MIFDAQNSFSATTNGAITGDSPKTSGAPVRSTNVIDLGIARDVGSAVTDELELLAEVITTFTSGGSALMEIDVLGAPDNGSGAPGSYAILYKSAAVPVATLVQGYKWLEGGLLSQANVSGGAYYRYLALNYVITVADMTAGTVVAGLVPAIQHSPVYAIGYQA